MGFYKLLITTMENINFEERKASIKESIIYLNSEIFDSYVINFDEKIGLLSDEMQYIYANGFELIANNKPVTHIYSDEDIDNLFNLLRRLYKNSRS